MSATVFRRRRASSRALLRRSGSVLLLPLTRNLLEKIWDNRDNLENLGFWKIMHAAALSALIHRNNWRGNQMRSRGGCMLGDELHHLFDGRLSIQAGQSVAVDIRGKVVLV
uniref:Uncharacterized protein n=1 Tax=Chromera velia CCMP2878 TaxID=1169474 RepID=A0A0G4HYU7_9ALVE|eukprot:Cvel_9568.t1-p1 / transcript=Cvel_9568.t1 / gene=Cvel_9568 / organism=Chromera_velia_CCMP2878 / gene_product=hypothetical protein / transcript_product=hypothetical protein / location=Cvel_scaffold554:74948-75277(-) / protein_length=110 / sequence_SO=supercontig / SO=protein_coding / is_pseudo=false